MHNRRLVEEELVDPAATRRLWAGFVRAAALSTAFVAALLVIERVVARSMWRILRFFSNDHLPGLFENRRRMGVTLLERSAAQLSALGHPVRLNILRFVVQGGEQGSSAGDIQAHVCLPASTLSHHLRRLVHAGLMTSRSEGTYQLYAASYLALRSLIDYLWEDCCKRGNGCC